MDVRKMKFEDFFFDCVIDKSLLDTMLLGDGGSFNIKLMLNEIYRVLSPTGVYICISIHIPKKIKKYLKNTKIYNWKIALH